MLAPDLRGPRRLTSGSLGNLVDPVIRIWLRPGGGGRPNAERGDRSWPWPEFDAPTFRPKVVFGADFGRGAAVSGVEAPRPKPADRSKKHGMSAQLQSLERPLSSETPADRTSAQCLGHLAGTASIIRRNRQPPWLSARLQGRHGASACGVKGVAQICCRGRLPGQQGFTDTGARSMSASPSPSLDRSFSATFLG